MLIVSQDENELINFDSVVSITTYKHAESGLWLVEATTSVNSVVLGVYQTKEETLKILEEIRNSYKLVNKGTGYYYSIAERKLL